MTATFAPHKSEFVDGRALAYFLIIVSLCLLFVPELSWQEFLVALIAGALGAGLDAALRMQTERGTLALRRHAALLPGVYTQALRDSGTVYAVLFRQLSRGGEGRGAFRRQPFDFGDKSQDLGRRVFATAVTSLQPNSYLLGFDRDRGEALIHQLQPSTPLVIAESLRRGS